MFSAYKVSFFISSNFYLLLDYFSDVVAYDIKIYLRRLEVFAKKILMLPVEDP